VLSLPHEQRRQRVEDNIKADLNTLWTGDADLRLYITTLQDG